MLSTIFIYNLTFVFTLTFAWLSEHAKTKKNIFICLSFICLFLLSCLRFNVGYDYENYVTSFIYIRNHSELQISWEFAYYFICKLFSFTRRGYVLVIGLYSFLTLFFLFKTLLYRNFLFLGVFIYMAYNMLFISYDQIRQALAIIIFIYSTKFIEQKKIFKYLIYIAFASFFHISAIALFPFYFIALIKPYFHITLGVIIIFIYGYFSGFWIGLREYTFSITPYYNFYALYQNQLSSAKLNSFIGVSYLIITNLIILWYLNKNNNRFLFWGTALGLLLYLFASNNLVLWRFANYFIFIQFIAIPFIIINNKNIVLKLFFLITAFVMFQMNIMNSPRGTSPYQSIFSDEFNTEIFNQKR